MKFGRYTLAALLAAGVVGCPEESDVDEEKPTTPAADLAPIDPATVGVISGHVRFDGPPPKAVELTLGGKVDCKAQHKGPVFHDAVKLEGGHLANVFVRVVEGLEGVRIPDPPSEPAVLDQRGCLYAPRVVGVQVRQRFVFLNSDPLMHNVHTVPKRNRSFNKAMPTAGMRLETKFRKPEVMVHTKCDVHPWMDAFIGVVSHPFFDVSNADGAVRIEGLPPGTYDLEAWHEVYGTRRQTVTLAPKGEASVAFTFSRK